MNKTTIEWVDYTWNPLTGCKASCGYCYARRIATRFAGTPAFPHGFYPTFHPQRLHEPQRLKKPSRILVCSMGDLFGAGVSKGRQDQVIRAAWKARQHTYFFLTKTPERYPHWPSLPQTAWNYWAGTTVENQEAAYHRIPYLLLSKPLWSYLSCEPLLGPVSLSPWAHVDWVIIGAMTGPGAIKPEPAWAQALVHECDERGIPVFCKNNLRPFVSDKFWRRELP